MVATVAITEAVAAAVALVIAVPVAKVVSTSVAVKVIGAGAERRPCYFGFVRRESDPGP